MALPSKIISGTVRDALRRPVPLARVYFTGGPVALPDVAMLTNDEGAFSLSVPAEGNYQIACAAEGFAPASATVAVQSGREARVQITLADEPR